jgi:hypothetical protein
MISVPIAASGLTAGGTYHLLIHQAGADPNNYVQVGECSNAQAWMYRPKYATGAWTPHANRAVVVNVYDQTPIGNLMHTWEDPDSSHMAAATTTMVNDSFGRLLGVCDQTAMPNDPLNANPTFTSGVSPWTATGGTLTQSSAQVHGGLPFSGLLTPTGGGAAASAQCELISISGAAIPPNSRWLRASGWVYSPGGYANVSLSVNWYDSARTLIAVSSNVVSVAAATWTNLGNDFLAPAGAAYAAIDPTESGAPSAGNALYLSNVTLTYSPGVIRPLSTVTAVDYDATTRQPVGTTVL